MSKLSCLECRAHLPKFYARSLNKRLNRQVIKHLRQCDNCLRLAEQERAKTSPIVTTTPHATEANSPIEGQAVVKWGVVVFMVMMCVSLACFAYDVSQGERVGEHVRTWVELRYPQGRLGTKEIDWTVWLPYYRHERHYPLLEQDGVGTNHRFGTVVITQRAWEREVEVRLHQREKPFNLSVPGQGGGDEERFSDYSSAAWEALEQLPETVKVDIAVSTRHFLTPRAMVEMLERYNSQLLRIYAYGGETAEERRQMPPLGLVLWTPQSGEVSLEESRRLLRENLESVTQYPILEEERHIWGKRLAYVEEHGFRTYGALVRGTPQELLQLREVLELRETVIMNINWVYG